MFLQQQDINEFKVIDFSTTFKSLDRIRMFIDGQYLYFAAKSDRLTVSYPKLKQVFQRDAASEDFEAFFYTSLDDRNSNHEQFLKTLQSMSYGVVSEGKFATLIVENTNDVDTVVIVSGNRDRQLVETVKSLTAKGIKVKLVAFPSSTDPLLWKLATEYVNILALPQVCQPSRR